MENVGLSYSKHWNDIKNIVFKLEKEDFVELYESGRSKSFSAFYEAIFEV